MKITKQQLKQIIKEEFSKVQAENRARLAQYRRERLAAAKERAAKEASEVIENWGTTDHDELKEKFRKWQINLVHKNPSAPQPIISAVRKELLNMGIEGI
jgi:hypothetical protein